MTVFAFGLLALFSTIVAQAVMGDRSLGDGSPWSGISGAICKVASWSTFCSTQPPLEEEPSNSTSTSTSTSLSLSR